MSEDESPKDIVEFLDKDGGLGLILLIDPEEGSLVGELRNKLHISKNTVTQRLKEARRDEYDLVEVVGPNPSQDQRSRRYVLTTRGEALQNLLLNFRLDEVYEPYVELHNILDSAPAELEGNIELMGLNKPSYESIQRGDTHIDTTGDLPERGSAYNEISERLSNLQETTSEDSEFDSVETWGEPESTEDMEMEDDSDFFSELDEE